MKGRTLAVLGLLFLCAGCVQRYTGYDSGIAAYQAGTPAPVAFDALAYEPLQYPSTSKFQIDEKSLLVDFPQYGKTFIKAFSLPITNTDYRLVLRSYAMLPGHGMFLFYPLITFLDTDKKVINTTTTGDLTFSYGGMGDSEPDQPARLTIDIKMTADHPARYLIVHTDQKWIDSGFNETLKSSGVPATALLLLGPVGLLAWSATSPPTLPPSPIGPFEINLQGSAP